MNQSDIHYLYQALEAAGVNTINADRIKKGLQATNEEGVESAILFAWRNASDLGEFKKNINEAITDLCKAFYSIKNKKS